MSPSTSQTDNHRRSERGSATGGDRRPDQVRAGPSPTAGPEPDRLGVTGSQVAGSVLASVSAAIVASVFGVTGTIVGAGVVSVVATVGSAAYGLGIRRTRHRLQQVQAMRLTDRLTGIRAADPGAVVGDDAGTAGEPSPTAGRTDGGPGEATAAGARPADGGARARPAVVARLAGHRWSLAAGLGLVLLLTVGSISLAELVTDRPLSGASSGGRTSIGALVSGDGDRSDHGTSSSTTTSTTTAPGRAGPAPTTTPEGPDGESTASTEAPSTTTTTTAPTTTTTPPTTVAPEPPPPADAPTGAPTSP